jgi:hypothetical protein
MPPLPRCAERCSIPRTSAKAGDQRRPHADESGASGGIEIEGHTVSQIDSTREHLIETYRKKAKHYDITSQFYPVPGYP